MIEEIMGWERSFLISIRFFKPCDFWLRDNKLKRQLKFQGCTSFTFASLFATLATQATHLPSIFHHKVENKAHMRYFSSISHQSSTIKIIINYLTQQQFCPFYPLLFLCYQVFEQSFHKLGYSLNSLSHCKHWTLFPEILHYNVDNYILHSLSFLFVLPVIVNLA